ncbi:glycosyltransferase [Erwinia papayae]|uniref:Glycosyltransferase n=1 Tax=Erwinia papayae TaxID=206499 RepID=A0ABV3N0N9_9GAMM
MRVGYSGFHHPGLKAVQVDSDVEYINCDKKNVYFYTDILSRRKTFLFKPLTVFPDGEVDIYHLFNQVALTDRKWLVTFDSLLAQVISPGDEYKSVAEPTKILSALAGENCVALIALSNAAYYVERKLLSRMPQFSATLLHKMQVIPPPQPLYVQNRRKRLDQLPVHFVFVAGEFYRQGGAETVLAFEQLLTDGMIAASQVRVRLVGDLTHRHNDALGAHQDSAAFFQATETAIARHSVFEHLTSMSQDQLRLLFQHADVGLLPSWAEAYGFPVLEMQSCGCPVITSNVRALAEINPPDVGWQIVQQLNDDLELPVLSSVDRDKLRQQRVDRLKILILDIITHPLQITVKANAAVNRIRTEHDPQTHHQKLLHIYNRPHRL